MSKKIKLVPVSHEHNNLSVTALAAPVEIIAPRSFDISEENPSGAMNVGVLGNMLPVTPYFNTREFNFNWIGSHHEINIIRSYLSNSVNKFFLFDGLVDSVVKTPSMLFNARAMLASLVEQYRPPGSPYSPMLSQHLYPNSYPRGSMGVGLSFGTTVAQQFSILPQWARGATGYMFLEPGSDYDLKLDFNYMSSPSEVVHATQFYVELFEVGTPNPIIEKYVTDITDITGSIRMADSSDTGYLAKLTVVPMNPTKATNPDMRGYLNYSAPLIYKAGTDSMLEQGLIDSLKDQPSLLTVSSGLTHNTLSANLAELSCSFQEISHDLSR